MLSRAVVLSCSSGQATNAWDTEVNHTNLISFLSTQQELLQAALKHLGCIEGECHT